MNYQCTKSKMCGFYFSYKINGLATFIFVEHPSTTGFIKFIRGSLTCKHLLTD